MDAAAALLDARGQSLQEPERVEAALSGEAQAARSTERRVRRVIGPLHRYAGAPRRRQFLLQAVVAGVRRRKQVAVHPREVTGDRLLATDLLDQVDGRPVTLGRQPRAFGAVQPLQHGVPVVQRVRQMRRRATGFATADGPVIDDDDLPPRPCQPVRRHHPGHTSANNAHVRPRILQ
jgi:hypothetical protein